MLAFVLPREKKKLCRLSRQAMITTAASKGRPEPTLVYIVKSAHLQRLRKHSGTIEEGKGKGNQSSAQQENRRLILKRISDERIRGWSDTVEVGLLFCVFFFQKR